MKNTELYHHGILGQKWGVRRYQNEDGSLTDEGVKRYARGAIDIARTYGPLASSLMGGDSQVSTQIINSLADRVEFMMSDRYDDIMKYLSDPREISKATMAVSRAVATLSGNFTSEMENRARTLLEQGDEKGFKKQMRDIGTNTGSIIGYNGYKMYKDYAKENKIKTKFDPFGKVKAASSGATLGRSIGGLAGDYLFERYGNKTNA